MGSILVYHIHKILTKRKIKTFRGNDIWTSDKIRTMLSNILYTGNTLARKQTRDLMTIKNRPSEGVRDQYYIENSHPAIVSLETYNIVQEKLPEKKKSVPRKDYEIDPLSKRITCGNCGARLYINRISPWTYYRCSKAIVDKSYCPSTTIREDKMRTMLIKAFKERFDFDDPKIIKTLQHSLVVINRNDNFEFHRLKALTHIQIARNLNEYSVEDIKELEKEYKLFEEKLIKIEDDRKYRISAIEWLKNIESIEEFEENVTIEYMRAWVLEIEVYSFENYKVFWIDGKETEIGNCEVIEVETLDEEEDSFNYSGAIIESLDITLWEGGDIESKEEKNMLAEKQSDTNIMFKDIKRQLSSSVIMQTTMPVVKKDKIKTAAYVRVSTENREQLNSLKIQYSYYLYLILKDPRFSLAGIYMDDSSGTTTKGRDEFNRMIEDCKAGKIDLIITKSISRFARNTIDTLTYLDMLGNLEPKVEVWFEKENLRSLDPKSSIIIKLLSALSQEESQNTSNSITWGKLKAAQRGVVHPSRLGYGYKYGKNKEWLVNEEEAEIVQRIYEEYLEGKNISQIATILMDDFIPSPEGNDYWYESSITRILSSEIYRGNYIYQRYHTGSDLIKKRIENKGELPMIFIDKHHTAIIDDEKWRKVQEIMSKQSEIREENIKKYPEDKKKNETFTKKLYCGKCGNIVGYARHINRQRQDFEARRWRCYRADKGTCDAIYLRQEYIEENFSQLLMDIKFNLDFNNYLSSFKESLKISQEEEKQREELKLMKENLNNDLYKVVEGELGKKGKDTKLVDELIEKIMELRAQIKVFNDREEQLELIEEEITELMPKLDKYKGCKQDDLGYYIKSPAFNKELFEQFVERGIINGDGSIIYRFNSGFEWALPINYEAHHEQVRRRKAAKRAAEKEKFLKGPEVKRLIEYCKEPKSISEMIEFLPRYLTNSNFKKFIVEPLMEKGIIKETIPDKPRSRLQKYYSAVG